MESNKTHIDGDFKCKKHNVGFISMRAFNEHAKEFDEKCGVSLRLKRQRDMKELVKVIKHGTTFQNRLLRTLRLV